MMVFYYFFTALLGLIVGSFLNVVIYRLPIMMKCEWGMESLSETPFNLAIPQSHCTQCKTRLKLWHNIPLISFILLKGRCQSCQQRIAYRYPFIELLTGAVSVVCFWKFGYSIQLAGALLFSWALIAMSSIDIAEKFIPDAITLPALWIGLLFNAFSIYTSPQSAILGATVGYVLFWSIAQLFLLIRKKEGLGYGDFKLLAMMAAWLGVASIPLIILIASVSGTIITILLAFNKKIKISDQIPFGPFLAIAGWYALTTLMERT